MLRVLFPDDFPGRGISILQQSVRLFVRLGIGLFTLGHSGLFVSLVAQREMTATEADDASPLMALEEATLAASNGPTPNPLPTTDRPDNYPPWGNVQ